MLPGVYAAQKKDGTPYFRAGFHYKTRHISLGSFSTEELAGKAYAQARRIVETQELTIHNFFPYNGVLAFEKVVSLINFRDNNLYFHNPIYLRKGYFSYFLTPETELKFDIDDLFYYSGHRIMRRKGHLFVSDYGMQYSILSRYGIRPYAVAGRDYRFANGDATDYRYSNIMIINRFHGVVCLDKNGKKEYKTSIHINGNYLIGIYSTEEEAAVAYNKAADLANESGIPKNFPKNYIDTFQPEKYAKTYADIRISEKYLSYLASVRKN